jgi:thioredoxin 1
MGSLYLKEAMIKDTSLASWSVDVLNQPLVLAYFTTSWCTQCKKQDEILDDLAHHFGPLQVVRLDSDQETELVTRYRASEIPTLLLFKSGERVWTLTGAKPLDVLIREVNPYV